MQKFLAFIIGSSAVYGALAFLFSIIGVFLPPTVTYVVGNPLEVSGISVEHIVGHIIWGLMVSALSLSLRYFVLGGIFPIILDSDHLIQFFDLEMVPRMAHSISFGFLASFVLLLIFGKRDYRLAGIAFATVLAHVSYDILLGGTTSFPLLTPFVVELLSFQGNDWIIIQLIAVAIVGICTIITRMDAKKKLVA
ncbi:MAG: hypothetical protein FJ359_04505 [Thaumarchaeota archaeon]|nr:hypothetical protein [Nitrososphaerota archaeon]